MTKELLGILTMGSCVGLQSYLVLGEIADFLIRTYTVAGATFVQFLEVGHMVVRNSSRSPHN